MSVMNAPNILSDATNAIRPYSRTHGAQADALVTTQKNDALLWEDAYERMLAWRSNPGVFDTDEQPSIEILDTAIDFAVDEQTRGGPAPTIIIPSGDGRVSFEWHSHNRTMIIEFVEQGCGKYTVFAEGRVVEKGSLYRNPSTRKLELGG